MNTRTGNLGLTAAALGAILVLASASGCARHYNAFHPDQATVNAVNSEIAAQGVQSAELAAAEARAVSARTP